ncbi:MAG: hypothetical protein L6R42_007009 [Xanthoria sp. 1 TBL-2021]|nr:MAG: hypothetical protein L6R42_007009 [Xanthoria sp. 1 TBL-2021]
MAELQRRQNVEDSSDEEVAGGLTPKEKPVEGMLPEHGQTPLQPGQSPSMFRPLQPEVPLHEHDKRFPSKRPSHWSSMDREPELLDLQSVPHNVEQQNYPQTKTSPNSKIRQKAMDPIACTKSNRALNGIKTQETASAIFNKVTKTDSQQDNHRNAGLGPRNRPSRPPSFRSLVESPSPLAAKRMPPGPNKHSPAGQFVDIDVKGKESSETHEETISTIAVNNDRDGWNVVEATEDGYDAVEVEHAGDMKGPVEHGLGHRDDGGWDLCG